jgi:hypothetical protein
MLAEFEYKFLGFRFLIERGKNFADNGRMIDGLGWFASPMDGRGPKNGRWFETKEQAIQWCNDFASTLMHTGIKP